MKKKEQISEVRTQHKLMDTLARTKIRAGYGMISFTIFLLLVVIASIFYSGNWIVFSVGLFICTALFLAGKSLIDSGNRLSGHVITGIGNDIRSKSQAHQKQTESPHGPKDHRSKSFIGHYMRQTPAKTQRSQSAQKHCINCGLKIPSKSKFCPKCGETQN